MITSSQIIHRLRHIADQLRRFQETRTSVDPAARMEMLLNRDALEGAAILISQYVSRSAPQSVRLNIELVWPDGTVGDRNQINLRPDDAGTWPTIRLTPSLHP